VRHRAALVAALAAALLVAGAPRALALHRPMRQIERAWRVACPHLSQAQASAWSKVLQREAERRSFCPYTVVSIVRHETGGTCNERLVYDKRPREYSVGLGQVNVVHHRDCRAGGIESPGCQAYIGMLMNGAANLRVVAGLITANRKFCRSKTGKPALFARWLSSYQGYNNSRGRRGVWCNMQQDRRGRWRDAKVPWATQRVMRYRRELLRRVK
jgi:hypothetical protein